jgi:hypothetical protein
LAGKKLMNPKVKVVVCGLGTALMAYALYYSVSTGTGYDTLFFLRGLAFIAFAYFFLRSLQQAAADSDKAEH